MHVVCLIDRLHVQLFTCRSLKMLWPMEMPVLQLMIFWHEHPNIQVDCSHLYLCISKKSSGKSCRLQKSVVLQMGVVISTWLGFWRRWRPVGLPITLERVDQSCKILNWMKRNQIPPKKEEAKMVVGLI